MQDKGDSRGSRLLLATAVVVAALSIAGPLIFRDDGTRASGSASGSPRPDAESPSVDPLPSPPASEAPVGPRRSIRLENLTSGQVSKQGATASVSTASVRIPRDSFVLVHLMSCCHHATAPRVTARGLGFDLLVTHETGEKRHWVFGAPNPGGSVSGAFTFEFAEPQGAAMWIVDAALNVELEAAIAQTAWQDSMGNAERGDLALGPVEHPGNAVVGFALAGSGAAVDIDPERGFTETAEAEVAGSSLIIDTFWGSAERASVEATFLDEAGRPAVQSWLFLAIELRARSAAE